MTAPSGQMLWCGGPRLPARRLLHEDPMFEIATPRLTFIADINVMVGAPIEIGETPAGQRRVIAITGGTVSGERLTGRVLPGGADFQVLRRDGVTDIHARYIIETDAGARVYIENTGVRDGPPDAMERLRHGEIVDPALIYFRAIPRFETSAPELMFLTRGLFLTSGARFPDRVQLRLFEIG